MRRRPQKPDPERQRALLEKIRKQQADRAQGYREQALKLFPHVCGRCGRSFSGKDLKELTVHHKDNNHFNNPPDGSNWELLCIYCHDNEHSRYLNAEQTREGERCNTGTTFKPFAELDALLKKPK